ncbi:MAG: GNAT family N-acetyltransferase [Paludibacteraceae bacterium]|nr:GNAT family N-acetyltransferase [Paludibacteraceae bacterium]MBO7338036.1 GNAT family N-acetyltransferase [Paludibacteraceae bacterium]MBP5136372.1 GNAT family N-acetyltransferase [Paludibacteraceae bacterium]MBP5742965.1 GNAT family N-acetyltransferase [Paludibacteraceae bacterium]
MKEKESPNIEIMIANEAHYGYVEKILDTVEKAAKARGTGIARRTPEYILSKMKAGNAIIAFVDGVWAGFCYIESWSDKKFVANSGLIVSPEFRGMGLAKKIKRKAFELSRTKYPNAKLFGITTGLAVMKINTEIGYRPVTFSELTDDPEYWKECEACINFDVLKRNNYTRCLCTGMLYDPAEHVGKEMPWKKEEEAKESRIERWKNALKKIFSLPIANGTYKGNNKDIEH